MQLVVVMAVTKAVSEVFPESTGINVSKKKSRLNERLFFV